MLTNACIWVCYFDNLFQKLYVVKCLTSLVASCDFSLVASDWECSLAYLAMSESSWVLCSLSSFWICTYFSQMDLSTYGDPLSYTLFPWITSQCGELFNEVLTFSCIVSLISAALLSVSATLPCSCTRWWASSKFTSDSYGIFKWYKLWLTIIGIS